MQFYKERRQNLGHCISDFFNIDYKTVLAGLSQPTESVIKYCLEINMEVIIIVDAYSTGKYLAPAFRSYGYKLVHIQSTKIIPKLYSQYAKDLSINFFENIIYSDIETILRQLEKYKVKFVIPGTESGVLIADLISEKLGLSTSNGTQYSLSRRDKYLMHQTLKAEGVAHIAQYKSSELKDILTWVKSSDSQFEESKTPVVLKPVNSAGTDNVMFCYSESDISKAFQKIKTSLTIFDTPNTEVLVQNYLHGTEYIVNTVSCEAKHFVTDIWRINKKYINNTPVCDFEEVIPPTEEIFQQLSSYTDTVLNALRIKYGAGHSEIMLTPSGPILIETAARLIGGIDPAAITNVLGYTQISVLVESYISPRRFLQCCSLERLPIQKYPLNIFLVSEQSGRIVNDFDSKPYESIQGFYSASVGLKKGDRLEKTNSFANCPGYIYFLLDDPDSLNKLMILLEKLKL